MSRVEDIMQMCRLCLDKDQVNTPIFDEPTDLNQTFLKISSCLPVKVSPEDNLPKKICDDCAYKLDMAYQFRNTSTNSEKQLIQLLGQIGIPPHQAPGKSEISVKLEHVAADDGDVSPGAQNYILQQQKLPYPQEFSEFGEEAPISESPPKKRAKRAAASKKPATVTKPPVEEIEEVETDPLIDASVVTKAEDDSDDSDNMALSSFATASATSSADQPGPSGIGKGATLNAPINVCISSPPRYSKSSGQVVTVSGNSKYSCLDCELKFTSKVELASHAQLHKNSGEICVICSESFSYSHELKEHVKLVHKMEVKYECTICKIFFVSLFTLKEHEKSVHSESEDIYPCPNCDFKFPSKAQLSNHKRVHLTAVHTCETCLKKYRQPYLLQLHMKKSHGISFKLSCSDCDLQFDTRVQLRNHRFVHRKGPKIQCAICAKIFTTKIALVKHKEKQHSFKQCPDCDTTFCSKRFLDMHLKKVHGKVSKYTPRYTCDRCPNTFLRQSSLNKHINETHKGIFPEFVCDVCGKVLTTTHGLQSHKKIHDGIRDLICEICGKTFIHSRSFALHKLVHTKEKPHACPHCEKRYAQSCTLNIHLRTHTGEKPYVCQICQKMSFISKSNLNHHYKFCKRKHGNCFKL